MISAVILTKNNEETLYNTLESLKDLNEIVIIDNGSTDKTIEIAQSFSNVAIFHTTFTGFGVMRNYGATCAKHNWVLAIDADEVLSSDLQEKLQEIELSEKSVYSFPFHNYFQGKWIKTCGWYPDRHIRLYNKNFASFSEKKVHEKLLANDLNHIPLQAPIYHYSYRTIGQFLTKMHFYSDLFAEENYGKRNSSFFHALYHGFFAFVKSYILKRGFLSGKQGYIISVYNGQTSYYKYLKLYEKMKRS